MKKAYFGDMDITVFDDVYEPDEDSFLLAKHVNPGKGSKVLDMGCGSGIISLVAAMKGAIVTACDINESALKNTEFNAAKLSLTKSIKTISSDLFENVGGDFDYVYFNPPYVPTNEDDGALRKKHPQLSKAWEGGEHGRETIKRFLNEVGKHMHEKSAVMMVASSKNDFGWLRAYMEFNGFGWEILDEKAFFFEVLSVFRFMKA